MYFEVETNSREAFINFARQLGKTFRSSEQQKNWFICLGADAESGKSLLALAIDQAFNPQTYPHGLTKDISADEFCFGQIPPDLSLSGTSERC